MARWVYMLIAFAGLAAWTSAQNPVPAQPPLSAEDKLRLLQANSTLIDQLVTDGVKMANADKSVTRVEYCRNTSRSLVNAILRASEAGEADRVTELAGLFHDFVRDGFVPMLQETKRNVPPESPAAEELRKIQKQANTDLTDLKAATSTGKISENQRVQDVVKQLDRLAEALK